jgi:4-hydroxybenzoate polyprenyltransferase
MKDAKKDREHPEKMRRPIASGAVSMRFAGTVSAILLLISLSLAYYLSVYFLVFPVALFLLTMVYTFWLKNVPIVDIHIISFNFLLRAVSGAVLITVPISSWLIIVVFMLALFLAIGKRKGEAMLLEESASKHRRVFSVYTKELLDAMSIVIATSLFISYVLYTFMAYSHPYMLTTIPVISFLVLRYLYFTSSGHKAARKAEFMLKDMPMFAGIVLWAAMSFVILYIF